MGTRRRERTPSTGTTNRRVPVHHDRPALGAAQMKAAKPTTTGTSSITVQERRELEGRRVLAKVRSAPALTKYRTTREILSKRPMRRKKSMYLLQTADKRKTSDAENTSAIEALVESLSQSLQQRYTGKRSLRKVFLAWDINRDGVVDPFELKAIFNKCGCCISMPQAREVCRYFGSTDEDRIPYDGFIDLIFRDDEEAPPPEERSMVDKLSDRLRDLGVGEEEIKRASEDRGVEVPLVEIVLRLKQKFQAKRSLADEFRKIDENHDGTLSVQELHDFMMRQNIEVPKSSLAELFRRFDRSSDGSIEYREFINLVFPERDVGAYKRLTPRLEGDEDSEDDEDDEAARRAAAARAREKVRRVTFATAEVMSDISDSLASGVRSALITARVRKQISERLSEDFESVASAFDSIDANKDGRISYGEFKAALLTLSLDLKESDADIFLRYIDQDGSGYVDYEEFKDCIEGRFGSNEVSGLAAASRAANADMDDDGPMTRMHQQLRKHLAASPDHEVSQLKTATASNVGLAFSNRLPNRVEMARIQTKRKLFPPKRRASTAPAAAGLRALHDGPSVAGQGRPSFDVSSLRHALPQPRRDKHTPVHDTTYLVRPDPETLAKVGIVGNYTYAGGEKARFQPETKRQFCLSRDSAYHRQPEQVKKRELYETRLSKTRETMRRYNDRPLPRMEDPDLHLKTILKHRLNYYNRLEKIVAKQAF